MKQELVASFTLESLIIAEQALLKNPKLEITFIAMNDYGYNSALALYDYSRTIEELNRIKVVLCGDQVNLMHLVALAAFEKENRCVLPHVMFKQSKLSSAAYGNQQDITSTREYLLQVKTACAGILSVNYDVGSDFHETDKSIVAAKDSGFFSVYSFGSKVVADLPTEESNIVSDSEDF
jgi:ATP-dependent protease ClpP protease subunit